MVLVFIAALAWSTAGLFTRVLETDIPTTLFWRSVFGGSCVLLIYGVTERPKTMQVFFIFTLGEVITAFISAMGMMCFISAFFFTSIANVSFVYGAMPMVTMLLAWAVLREAVTRAGLATAALSGLGVVSLVWGRQNLNDFLGIILAMLMTVFMAAVTVSAKFFPEANAMKSAYLSSFMAAAIMLAFSQNLSATTHDILWLMLYGAVNVGLGFGVYLMGVSRVPVLVAALIGLVEIPLAPTWAFILFNEQVSSIVIFGGTLILISSILYVFLSAPRRSKRANGLSGEN